MGSHNYSGANRFHIKLWVKHIPLEMVLWPEYPSKYPGNLVTAAFPTSNPLPRTLTELSIPVIVFLTHG